MPRNKLLRRGITERLKGTAVASIWRKRFFLGPAVLGFDVFSVGPAVLGLGFGYASRFVPVIPAQGHANLLCIVPILSDDPRRIPGFSL